MKSELEATKGKTGYKIVEVEKEVAADSLLQVITRPYRGKVVLVDMWNTWCGPCMRAMKSLKPLKEELKEVVYLYIADETSPEGKWKVTIPDIPGFTVALAMSKVRHWQSCTNIRVSRPISS